MSDSKDAVGSNSALLRPGMTRQRSSQESQTASLSTTPKQSNLGFQSFSAAEPASNTVRATSKGSEAVAAAPPASWQQRSSSVAQTSALRQPSSSYLSTHDRESSSFDASQAGYALRTTPQQRPAFGRDTSQSQRTVSYAPSDIETVSGVSASEYSSGDDENEPSRSVRGRYRDSNNRQSVSDARPGLLDPGRSGGTQKGRRTSSFNRESSRVRRSSQAPRDPDYSDLPDDDQRYGPQDDEDDEVQPRDRGEQLVRRRMKERQREKAARKKAEKDRARQSTAYPQPSSNTPLMSPNLKPTSTHLGQRSTSPSRQLDRSGRPTTILLPPSGMAGLQPNVVSPSFQQSIPSPSPAANKSMSGGYPSPHSHIRRTNSQQPSRQSFVTSAGPRSSYNATTADNLSVAGRSLTEAGSSVAGSVHGDDPERDAGARASAVGDDDNYEEDDEDQGTPPSDDDDDDDQDDEDVEYTLKDRQDAINIEHPFGLPIWKPALYKKSRSVTRNAEIALQSIPSAAAERHYLPGNILWTILFGSWLSLICFTFSVLINFVPFGGSLYARVIWELAGYLFWPFGKYVEVEVSPDSGDRTASNAEFHGSAEPIVESPFTPVAARYPHDHTHVVPFNSRPASMLPSSHSEDRFDTLRPDNAPGFDAGESSGSSARRSTPRQSDAGNSTSTSPQEETSSLKGKAKAQYGTMYDGESGRPLSSMERIEAEQSVYGYVHDEHGQDVGRSQRIAGRIAFALVFGLVLFPLMGLVCLACWGMVFTIPMAKLNWVLLKNLATRPLALHFRSAHSLEKLHDAEDDENEIAEAAKKFFAPLKPGEPAPRLKSINAGNVTLQRRSKILLCTYRAVGVQYYKYTVGGVNILFVNTVPLVFFTIIDFFLIEKYVAHHGITYGFLAFISGQGVIFTLALGSVIPLSYFIGMAVASISAQSSIGMGAVINATFGSIIEIILYAIALTQKKARLVEGSLVGSILAGVLLMPGLSMCSGATRRKEQRFNARSAGVTSTMLIMAIIGILTPTLFYQIYGTFQLTCEGCPSDATPGDSWSCRRCFYEHVPPATDPFFQQNVRGLMYTCTVILVLSYGVGLWFSLRTHASQIWQNPLPVQQPHQISTQPMVTQIPSAQRASIYKRLVPAAVMQQLLPTANNAADRAQSSAVSNSGSTQGTLKMPSQARANTDAQQDAPPPLKLPEHFSQEDYERAMALTASAFHNAFQQQQHQQQQQQHQQANQAMPPQRRHSMNVSQHQKHISMHEEGGEDGGGHGGHDAPSWSRGTSLTVLISCTVLYAIIAEILVDVVDVVLDGSGLDEKFLGITLFALVPNTTEFMNAMSFAINGNIALSMEIGSAYALQVCLIQIPAMVVFSAYYNAGLTDGSLIHRSFTLIFPRWDVIAIIFSVFLLTYTYIESRSNYYRGTICILSYMVLVAGFYFAPPTGDTEAPGDDNRGVLLSNAASFVSGGMGVLANGLTTFTLGNGGAFGAAPSGVTRASGVELARASGYSTSHALSTHPFLADPPILPHLNLAQWTYALWTSLWAR